MALPDRHPEYTEHLGEWIQLIDTFKGQRAVKSKRLDYLPATEGMVQDGMTSPTAPGWKDYEAYLMRAYFHDVMKDAVKAMIGIMHEKPAIIKVPKRLEAMLERATIQGEGCQALLRRINVAQLLFARAGLLTDVPEGMDVNSATPYISLYDDPVRIINWDAGRLNEGRNRLQLVVLDEGGYRRVGLNWKTERKYRVLVCDPSVVDDSYVTPDENTAYGVCVKVDDETMPTAGDFKFPSVGGRTLSDIPFVFIGANDLVPEPEVSPLLGLSNLSLAIYRGEADYRQTLYLQGQQTLVIIGGNVDEAAPTQLRVGNKGVIDLKLQGDAKYIGASADGLSSMRASLEDDKLAAAQAGVAFLDVSNSQGESGEALRIRVAARTTTVSSIAQAGGKGLEQALKYAAMFVGEDPDEVSVEPVTDFADQTVAGAALLAFMQAKQLGLPLSLRSMHRMMRLNDMTELDFEQENEQIEVEASSMLGLMVGPFVGATDDDLGDGLFYPQPGPDNGGTGGDPADGGEPPAPGSGVTPKNKNTPVKAVAGQKGHLRGSPVPLKRKVGNKGASANKTKGGA